METETILGISYSSRMIGLAIISSNHLVDYSVKLYKERWTPLKCDKIKEALQSCIKDYNIEEIVLSIPPHYYQTEAYEEITDCIHDMAQLNNLPITHQSYKLLLTLCTQKEKKNKNGFMRSLVCLYPELNQYYIKERRNKKKYYVKLFEAIGVAVLQSQLNKKKHKLKQGL